MAEKIILRVDFEGADVTSKQAVELATNINKLGKEKSRLAKEIKNLDESTEDYNKELARLTTEQNEVNAQLKVAKKEYREVERAAVSSTVASRGQKDSLVALRSELSTLTTQFDNLSKAERNNEKIGGKLNKQINSLQKEIGTIEEGTGRFQRSVGNYGKAFKGLGRAITVASGAFAAISAAFQSFQFIREFSKDIGEANKLVEDFTGLTGDAAKNLGSLALSISETYGAETKEVLQAANNLSRQFGISQEEALNKISLGFAAGLNANGQFLDQLKEYPTLLKEVGLNADETFNIIQRSVQEGVYSDKGVDAIKEAGLRLRELPKATREALDGIGLSSVAIEKSLANGTKSIKQVIGEVSTQLGKLPPQSAAVGTAIADIFGGAGEDAGLAFLTTLESINGEFNEQTVNLTEAGQAQKDLQEAQQKVNDIFNEYFGDSSVGFTELKTAALGFVTDLVDGVQDIVRWFKNIYNESESLRVIVGVIGAVFSNVFGVIKARVLSVVDVIKGLVESVSFLLDGEFSKAGESFAKGFEDAAQRQIDLSKKIASEAKQAAIDAKNNRLEVLTKEQEEAIEIEKEKQKKIEEQRAIALQKEKIRLDELNKARLKQIEKQKAAEKKAAKESEQAAKKEAAKKLSDTEKLETLILNAEQEAELSKIENKRQFELRKLEIARDARKQEISESLADDTIKQQALLAIDQKFATDKAELDAQQKEVEAQESLAAREQLKSDFRGLTDSLVGAAGERGERLKNQELKGLQEQLDQGVITQEEFDKKEEEIERKAFNRRKKLEIAQVAISLAREIASINANAAANPANALTFGGAGVSQAAVLTGIAVGRSALQAGLIASQSFADGGFTGGGLAPADHTGQKPAGIVHDGEFVANKQTLGTPLGMGLANVLNGINQNPALGYFAEGGFTSRQIQFDEQGMAQAIGSQMADIQVVNVASETSAVDRRTKFVRNKGRI